MNRASKMLQEKGNKINIMSHLNIPIKKLYNNNDVILPKLQTSMSAAADIHACIDVKIVLKPMERVLVPTGFAIAVPQGFEAQIRPRSGLALKYGVTVLNAPGTIDADYRGEVGVILVNLGQDDFTISPNDRIAQILICRLKTWHWQETDELDETQRSAKGFGSTGF